MKFYILFSLFVLTVVNSEEKCGENQHYNECGTACPVTCDNYEDPPFVCIRICVPGCHCDEDYVLTDDGRCVKSEECPPIESSPDICELPAQQGVCDALFYRFYFDKTTGRCEKFVYGGCGGNRNNFRTLQECEKTCGSAICELPAEPGVCDALFYRFYFDKTTGKCEKFVYGGCGGNRNNFRTLQECEKTCG